MKSFNKYLTFNTEKKLELVNITSEVESAIEESKVREGLALVSAMHITAGVFINDEESGIKKDIEEWLQKLAPEGPDYRHHRTGEVNGDAHLKSILVGNQVIIPITDGKADFGPWQQVFYAEFDGRRRKRLLIKIIGE
ncbi:MAG: YjbQ family protein [Candidatus Schekmanbacteria bacterium]|nr:MAG: YjbQ family protein [Candidatus Schekmanbacteria bacterium]